MADVRKINTKRAADEAAVERRRVLIAALLVSGESMRQIVARLEAHAKRENDPAVAVSLATVGRDVEAIREGWRERATHSYDEWRAEESAKLDAVESRTLAKAQGGDLEAVRVFVRVAERRARLHGLDKPIKVEATLSAEQLGELITKVVEGVLADVGVKRTPDVGRTVARHLRLVAAEADAVAGG